MSKTILGLALIAFAAHAAAATQYIRFGKLIDGKGKVWTNVAVVVENDRIRSVEPGGPPPSGAEVVDLRCYTGIPGMIDAHTHMTYFWDQTPGTKPWAQASSRQSAMTVFLAQENARKTLETGVTAVRDLGSSEYADIAMRDLINRGAMVGPRMFVAGYGLSVTNRQHDRVPPPRRVWPTVWPRCSAWCGSRWLRGPT